jgi:hypothetical protein
MNNFDYKKYSLENLERWIEDAINSSEASPQEIYDVIKNVVADNYYCYKNHTERCYELLALLNGNGYDKEDLEAILGEKKYYEGAKLTCDKDDKSPECQQAWNDFWEKNYYPEESSQYTEEAVDDGMRPWGHSDLEYLANSVLTEDRISNFPGEQYSEEELNAMCDKAASDEEKNKCREYNLREAEYYDKRAKLDAKWKPVSVPSKPLYVSEDGDVWIPDTITKEDKVVRWQLPVEVDGLTGDCYVQFPDDLLEAANLKEGDLVEWIDRKNGSFELRKVNGTK